MGVPFSASGTQGPPNGHLPRRTGSRCVRNCNTRPELQDLEDGGRDVGQFGGFRAASSRARSCPLPTRRRRRSSTSPARPQSAPAPCRATRSTAPEAFAVDDRAEVRADRNVQSGGGRQRIGALSWMCHPRGVQRHQCLPGERGRVGDEDVGLRAATPAGLTFGHRPHRAGLRRARQNCGPHAR